MSFCRDTERELAWSRWARAHEAELSAIGIPREVWADRMTWWRFLEHSLHPPASNPRDVRFRLADCPTSNNTGCTSCSPRNRPKAVPVTTCG